MFCINCGRRRGETPLFDIGERTDVLSQDLKTCLPCISKYGQPALKKEANSAFARSKLDLFPKSAFQLQCSHCDEGLVFWNSKGKKPLYCRACNRRRLKAMHDAGVI